jgi:transposase-like protein
MIVCARYGWNVTSTHRGSYAPAVGTPNGVCSRAQGYVPAYRCRACDGYYTLRTGTVFEKTRLRPATLGLLLRGMAKGEPTARLARELGLSRKQLHTLRRRIQVNLNETAPTAMMRATAFEADERYQHAGEKQPAPSRSSRSAPPTRPQAHRARHLCE